MSAVPIDSPIRLQLGSSKVLVGAIATAAVAVSARLIVGPGALGYDAAWSLLWGRELAAGRVPDLTAPYAPTPHPLSNAVAVLLAPSGEAFASGFLMALSWLCLGALAWGLARLGAALFSWPVGLLAATLITTREVVLQMTAGALVDLPFLALVVWAAVLEVERSRRGTAVLALLTAAGLLRPEAWLLAAAYALWLLPRQESRARTRTVALASAAPLIWATCDLVLTGDPLHSLHGTQQLAGQIGRPRSLPAAIDLAPRYLRTSLGDALAPFAALGLLFALAWRRRAALLPCALIALGLGSFAALGLASLPLLERYLLLPTVMLVLFGAAGMLAWTTVPIGDRRRGVWRAVGVVGLLVVLIGAASDVERVGEVRAFFDERNAERDDLLGALSAPAVAAASRTCEQFVVDPFHRPLVILWADRSPASVGYGLSQISGGAIVFQRAGVAPAGRSIAENERWTASVRGC